MIKAENVSKRFDGITAVDNITVEIKEGLVFGMVGTNGAGKSTLLRMIAGVLKADEGIIMVDEQPVYENPLAKREVFYISDDAYYLNNGTPVDMADYYGAVYDRFNRKRYIELLDQLGLPLSRKISTFSKGMKKQVSILLGVCAGTKYLLCDETFDGLDPVMRQAVKSIFAKEITERGLTPVLASHNLRELEDICDHVGLLHKGGVLLSKDLEEMRTGIHKLQCVFESEEQRDRVVLGLEVVNKEQRGRLVTLTVRGNADEVEARVAEANPVFYEMLPLTLEEIFISETEVAGYDFKKLIL
ncbi:MAG: ABC transporter ATP-binding protein [Lachnospiraceae bacterium]|nr:ABC transporter ATP-binding protein [Lachnospiraceae bacterium]